MSRNRSLLDRAMQFVQPRLVRDFAPPPTAIASGIWCLDRRMRLPGGLLLPTRSTIIRLPSRGLLVVSPPPVEPGGLDALDALGAVEEILVPNSFHYLHARGLLDRYPRATVRLAPALHARVAGLPGEELTGAAPAAWGRDVAHHVLGPVRGISEVAVFHAPSATLILTDVAFNMVHYASGFDRLAWRLNGVPAAFGHSRTARTFLLNDRAASAAFLSRVLEWPFRRVVVAHGDILDDQAVEVFRRAFADYLNGA